MEVGKSIARVDAFDKVTGRTKYTDDLCDASAYVAKILHSTIAHGKVLSVDTSEAEKIEGVVKIVTCFDLGQYRNYFPTAGHPWSTDVSHQDVADRLLLTDEVKFYGDDVAAVIAENEVAASQALRAIKVEYEEYPVVTDVLEAMKDGAPQIHKDYPNNILKHTSISRGNYAEAIKEEGLTVVDRWYNTEPVQHCHIENFICYAYAEGKRITIVASTQIPHIARRVVGQALGIPWGDVRVIKPYIGGGFGNKQDILYEPLCAFLSLQVGGHLVKLDCSREETFFANRTRHGIRFHIISHVRKDGTYAARKIEAFSNQGAYASHGHSIAAKGLGAFPQLYPCDNVEGDAYTVFTNRPVAGAMRGYGIPQAMFAVESHTEDVAKIMGIAPIDFRLKNLMPQGYKDAFSKNENYYDTFRQCIEKGKAYMDYDNRVKELSKQTGRVRTGIGMAAFWYNTAVWPISLESSSSRLVLNQDGSVTLQLGETEIGQGADTAFSQMAAEILGISTDEVHIVSNQDTDITPFGTGAYASRQTYIGGFSIAKTAGLLKEKILDYAYILTNMPPAITDIKNSMIIRTTDNRELISLKDLATEALYSLSDSRHITAESTAQIKSNAYSFGCCFAEVEVDIDMCKAKLTKIINVHDCGKLINPALAKAQVEGGMSMGIGYALSEVQLVDKKTGKVLNDNLLDYKLSTCMDHPHLETAFVENPEPTSPFGTKSLGEPPVCPVAPAIRNAIMNATGVGVNELPLRPEKLYEYFDKAGLLK
ncbi:xanthine dehydrogenase molybdenum-binding subunit XdhA [Lachnoanaerobaculum sp. Marseille-Q4761]|uniref:xanthine dehydrogenase subunit XdhA n=1 Tax=Lachnoanaerobaculum sp. Marseille-Q4761 TaxID=2819511 RepID=UPI001AA0E5A8|nr:xanthine dehydrogenase subunit XdhA [Lachnoanaerobaculum sp. Marseille-Q4761]MBO1871412.1 xanthine dehydrogenase molybdenum-binding subunit XdhA [Lachnoanaerobaculum sp. Marseille-Q4761]